jgi:hypothetical protein
MKQIRHGIVIGAWPQFVKAAVISRELARLGQAGKVLVHG